MGTGLHNGQGLTTEGTPAPHCALESRARTTAPSQEEHKDYTQARPVAALCTLSPPRAPLEGEAGCWAAQQGSSNPGQARPRPGALRAPSASPGCPPQARTLKRPFLPLDASTGQPLAAYKHGPGLLKTDTPGQALSHTPKNLQPGLPTTQQMAGSGGQAGEGQHMAPGTRAAEPWARMLAWHTQEGPPNSSFPAGSPRARACCHGLGEHPLHHPSGACPPTPGSGVSLAEHLGAWHRLQDQAVHPTTPPISILPRRGIFTEGR